jgi:chromosome segregation ATPase
MKRCSAFLFVGLLALGMAGTAQARKDDIDVARLTNSLDQLSGDPTLGVYAQAEQALARNAIAELANAGSHERPHALYIAERRVDQARAAAQLADARDKLSQLAREHDQLLLQRSQIDADAARKELEFQRMQYQMAQEEAARLQQQGMEAASQAQAAQAEAERARKLAAAQSRVARAAKREAALAAEAARAMRSQMQQGDAAGTAPAKKPRHGGH